MCSVIVARAPLRIPLGGGGTDFPSYYLKYGGYILGFALDKYVHVVMHDTIDDKIRLKYSKTEEVNHMDDLENRVAAEALKWYGITSGIEVATFSDVPECSGLGGSSAFCVALVAALRHKLGMSDSKEEIMASAYDIERNQAKQPGGMQDQFFASFGGAWKLELGEQFETEQVDVSGLLPRLKLIYTNTGRTSLRIASSQNENITRGNEEVLANLRRVKELGYRIEGQLRHGNYDRIGELFHKHWENKKKRHPAISNTRVNQEYKRARAKGVLGGKLLGLGGGGYLLLYSTNGKASESNWIDVGLDTEGSKICYEG